MTVTLDSTKDRLAWLEDAALLELEAPILASGKSGTEMRRLLWVYKAFWKGLVNGIPGEALRPEAEEVLKLHLVRTQEFEEFVGMLFPGLDMGAIDSYRPIFAQTLGVRFELRIRAEMNDPSLGLSQKVKDYLAGHELFSLMDYLLSEEGPFAGDLPGAVRGLFDYLRYFSESPLPSDELSENLRKVWEAHILFVRSYREFCNSLHGRMIHYAPPVIDICHLQA